MVLRTLALVLVLVQANTAEELPEALLGAVRLNGFGVEDPVLQRKLYPS